MLEAVLLILAAWMWPVIPAIIEYLIWGRKERAKKNDRVGELFVQQSERQR